MSFLKSVGKFVGGAIPFVGMGLDAMAQHSANKTNKKIAREQMAFQERMSSTEMQRRVGDLQAAGLNPMLAGMNQQGASSAQGASTRVEPITRNTASSALAIQTQRANLENIAAQTKLLAEQRRNVAADTNLKGVTATQTATNTQVLESQIQKIAQEFKNLQVDYDISEQQLREKKLTNAQLEKMQPLLVEYQMAVNRGQQLGMTQKEIDQKFAEELGQASKYFRFIQQIFGTPRGDVK